MTISTLSWVTQELLGLCQMDIVYLTWSDQWPPVDCRSHLEATKIGFLLHYLIQNIKSILTFVSLFYRQMRLHGGYHSAKR